MKYILGYPLDFISVSSPYGDRIHPITGKLSMHQGIDYRPVKRGYKGDTVKAIFDGVVRISKMQNNGKGWGNYIVIESKELGLCTVDAHLSVRSVRAGQKVEKGQKIGEIGNTGSSTNVHLHHGVFKCEFDDFFDKYTNSRKERLFKHAVDPSDYDGRVVQIEREDSMSTEYIYCGRTLRKGRTGTDVRIWQRAMKTAGYYHGAIDGSIGNQGHNAIIEFQRDRGIEIDGFFGRGSARELNFKLNELKQAEQHSQPDEPNEPNDNLSSDYEDSKNGLKLPRVELKYGSKGNHVRNLQVVYHMIGDSPDIDGSFGNQMKALINKTKAKLGLKQDGIYDIAVHNALGKEVLSKKTISYKYGSVYYHEVHKDEIGGMLGRTSGSGAIKLVNSKTSFVNATFRYYDSKAKQVYPTTPFVANGICHVNRCAKNYGDPNKRPELSWYGDKMPHFVIKKDGTVYTEVMNNIKSRIHETDFAVGGVGMYPKVIKDGFTLKNWGGIWYITTRHAICFNEATNRIVIAVAKWMSIYKFADRIKSHGHIHTVGLDSGGSTQGRTKIWKRNSGRVMAYWITFPMAD